MLLSSLQKVAMYAGDFACTFQFICKSHIWVNVRVSKVQPVACTVSIHFLEAFCKFEIHLLMGMGWRVVDNFANNCEVRSRLPMRMQFICKSHFRSMCECQNYHKLLVLSLGFWGLGFRVSGFWVLGFRV